MLKITIPNSDAYNEDTGEFILIKGGDICLEHSLVSIAKWESKWHKPFLSKEPKTQEETIDYFKCMCITPNVDENIFYSLSQENANKINKYLTDPMTATTFSDKNSKKSNEIITSEIIYYAMVAYNIPFECQKWHINRLLTLIKVCAEKNKPEKKMSQKELISRNKELNAARRKALNTRG